MHCYDSSQYCALLYALHYVSHILLHYWTLQNLLAQHGLCLVGRIHTQAYTIAAGEPCCLDCPVAFGRFGQYIIKLAFRPSVRLPELPEQTYLGGESHHTHPAQNLLL